MQSRRIVDLRAKRPGIDSLIPVRFAPQSPKRSPLRTRRRRIRLVIALIFLAFVGALAYGVSWASYLPQYNIQTIDVVGTKALSKELVRTYVDSRLDQGGYPFLSPKNIFLFHPGMVAEDIERFFPRVRAASLERDAILSTNIIVTVAEREAYAAWCDTAGCYLLDEGGFIFSEASTSSPSISGYVFHGDAATSTIGHRYAELHFPGMVALLTYLQEAGFTPEGASIVDHRDLTVRLAEGFYLKVSFGQDASALVRNLKLALSAESLQGKLDELEYADLRFGNKVYYKMKGTAEAESAE